MARLQKLKLPKGVEIDEVSNDNFFTHPSARSVPTTLAVKDYLHDEIDKHDQEFMPDGLYRNAIINGNFDVWQRGTSFPAIANGAYCADRYRVLYSGSGKVLNVTRGEFTLGQTAVPGNPQYYIQLEQADPGSGSTYMGLFTYLEGVRFGAGLPVTLSYYARTTSGDSWIHNYIYQVFGSGGSAGLAHGGASFTLTDEWQHCVMPTALTSLSGKTIGTNPHLRVEFLTTPSQAHTIQIAQVQLNIGDKPLPFAPRPYAEELALCQRYYRTWTQQTENGRIHVPLWPPMRVAPTMVASAGTISNITAAGFNLTHNAQAATTITASSEL
jgi:hypothetical protein